MATGALTVVLMAPQAAAAGPALSNPVQLLSSPVLPAIDQLLEAQQQVNSFNSALPFVTPFDLTRLEASTQNLAIAMLDMAINRENFSQFHDIYAPSIPYEWSAPAADPQGGITGLVPDFHYNDVPILPNQTYVITVDPGPGTQDLTFAASTGNLVTGDITPIPDEQANISNFTPNPDGTYSIILSSTPQQGNWFDTTGADQLAVRDVIGNWGLPHDSVSIQAENAPATYTLPVLSDDQISSMLSTIAANMPRENASGTFLGTFGPVDHIPDNTFLPIAPLSGTVGGGATQTSGLQVASIGHFSLEPDQALIVKAPDIAARYSGITLDDGWAQPSPYVSVQGSLNDTQAFHDPDGFTYYVISGQDPGVANWVNDSDFADGNVVLRWQHVADPDTIPATSPQAEVVNVADVRNDLPADTPTVTPAERAADLQERLLEYDYREDQTHNMGWVTNNLEYDQIKAAMGADHFNQVFGGQQDVPSVLDRLLSPALSPNLTTVAHDILTNPDDSLSAIINNLPLAAKDIDLPIVLAALRLEQVFEQGTGVQGLETVFNETLADPTTSITAGILNARDDLAVSIMNAGNYSPLSPTDFTSVWDQLSQLAQSDSQMLSGGLNSLLNLFDSADTAAPAADLTPNASGLPLDLLP
jgi:hypothetical protein